MNIFSGTFTLIFFLLIFHPTKGKTWRTRSSSKTSKFESSPFATTTTTVTTTTAETSTWQRSARYARYDPPKIVPTNDFQTVKAGTTYTFRCEGFGRGVSWKISNSTSSDDLINRISLQYSENEFQHYITELTIRNIVYSDTGTFTCSYNGTLDLSSIDNSTNVHLYVDDGEHLLKHSSFEFYVATQGSTFNLPCMPTLPDVNVTLWRETPGKKQILPDKYVSYNPKVGFNISPVVMNLHSGEFTCRASLRGREEIFMSSLTVLMETTFVPMPFINQSLARHIKMGDDLNLACSVTVDFNVMVELSWIIPGPSVKSRIIIPDPVARNLSLAPGISLKQVEQGLTIKKATKDDQGLYECKVVDHSGNTKTKTEFIRVLEQEETYIRIYYDAYQTLDITLGLDEKPVQWVVQIEAHPQPTIEWYDPQWRKIDPSVDQDYEIQTQIGRKAQTMLRIKRLGLSKAGNYMVKVYSDTQSKTENFTLVVRSKPKVQVSIANPQDLYQLGMEQTLKCTAKGYPIPEIRWMFKPCSSYDQCDNSQTTFLQSIDNRKFASYGRESVLKVIAAKSGRYICQACNSINCNFEFIPFFVTDVPDAKSGFSVEGPHTVMVGEPLRIKCSASMYNFSQDSIEWYKDSLQGPILLKTDDNNFFHKVTTYSNDLSFGKEITFESISLVDKGRYICRVKEKGSAYHHQPESLQEKRAYDYVDGQKYVHPAYSVTNQPNFRELSLDIRVLPLDPPEFAETNMAGDDILIVEEPNNGLMLKCKTSGRPRPSVKWFLHGSPLQLLPNTTRVQFLENGEVLQINYVTPGDEGLYECRAENKAGQVRAAKIVQLLESAKKDALYANISLPVVVIVGIALCLVVILVGLAKWFYHKRGTWKEPNRPQTPRLTQYELPQNQEDDDCRMTLTSSITRDGSISPNDMGHFGSHLMPIGPPCQDPCHCHGHVHQPCHLGPSVMIPKCTICEYSMQTLPLQHRMNTMGSKHTLGRRYDPHRSRSHSPRLSAEF